MKKTTDIRKTVQKAYAGFAKAKSSCCGGPASCCGPEPRPGIPVPESELGLSCGNPVSFSQIRKGDTVLDLGSGAGKDVFIAAGKVGPKGRVIGVDMTPEMLSLARRNAMKFKHSAGLDNVEFRKGTIEDLPLNDGAVDLVISNCVINLSPDKPRVFREAFRVLKPGGRLVVSDIVLNRTLPQRLSENASLYAACIAGALLREDYLKAIREAGFVSLKLLADTLYEASNAGDDPLTIPNSAIEKGNPSQCVVQKSAEFPEGREVLTIHVSAERGSPGRSPSCATRRGFPNRGIRTGPNAKALEGAASSITLKTKKPARK